MRQQGYVTSDDGLSLRLYVTDNTQNISLGVKGYANSAFTPVLTADPVSGISTPLDIVAEGKMQCLVLIQTSDERTKDNITDLSELEAYNAMKTIRARSFRFKNSPEQRRLGVIAQELAETLPHLVHTKADGMLSVNYVELQMYTLVAVQRLMREVEQLRLVLL